MTKGLKPFNIIFRLFIFLTFICSVIAMACIFLFGRETGSITDINVLGEEKGYSAFKYLWNAGIVTMIMTALCLITEKISFIGVKKPYVGSSLVRSVFIFINSLINIVMVPIAFLLIQISRFYVGDYSKNAMKLVMLIVNSFGSQQFSLLYMAYVMSIAFTLILYLILCITSVISFLHKDDVNVQIDGYVYESGQDNSKPIIGYDAMTGRPIYKEQG